MEIKTQTGDILGASSDLSVLGVFEDVPLSPQVANLLEPGDFRGSVNQTLLLYPRGTIAPRRLLLVGLGKHENLSTDSLRQVGATAVKQAQTLQVASVSVGVQDELPMPVDQAAQAFTEGIKLGAYRYWRYRTGLSSEQTFTVEQVTVFTRSGNTDALQSGIAFGQAIADGVLFARDLVNGPGYYMTPAKLGEEAQALGKELGLKVTVFDKNQLTEQGFGGILAVGKGSDNDPRFIIMEYGTPGGGKPTICLVGKGLTFDSGGLSLKPPDAMETMKSDMGGAAAVFGAMRVVATLNLPLHVVGLVSSAENMPSSNSYRPGDVVKSLSGKTIEVLNTDAEGRIILSDGLYYAQRYNPDAIVELSTLTGAIIIALGSNVTGMMATDQALADRITRAGEASDERVWQLPLWDEYHQMIKSEIADIKNLGGRPAGSITAGAFLAAFVGDYPFVHLDVAGTAWTDKPAKSYMSPGGTGVGVRLLTAFLREYAN